MEEKKKIILKTPPSFDATLEEWIAFRPYSFMTAMMRQARVYTLSQEERNSKRTQKKGVGE